MSVDLSRQPYRFSRRRALKAAAFAALSLGGSLPPSRAAVPGRERSLVERSIPGSAELIPALGLGTWQTFDVADAAQRAPLREVLKLFVAMGGSVIDSSPMYGNAEQVVGDLAAALGVQHALFLATKVWTQGREAGIRQMERSMQRLRTDRIDLMQVHNLVDWQTQLRTLQEWKESRRVRYIGITHYTSAAYDALARLMRTQKLDFVQFNYSVAAREAERELLPLAAERGLAVLVNRPFEGGGLFGRVRGRELPPWAADFDCESWAQFFLKYVLSHPAVTCAIPATANPKHLIDNMRGGYGRLPGADERRRMAALIETL